MYLAGDGQIVYFDMVTQKVKNLQPMQNPELICKMKLRQLYEHGGRIKGVTLRRRWRKSNR